MFWRMIVLAKAKVAAEGVAIAAVAWAAAPVLQKVGLVAEGADAAAVAEAAAPIVIAPIVAVVVGLRRLWLLHRPRRARPIL